MIRITPLIRYNSTKPSIVDRIHGKLKTALVTMQEADAKMAALEATATPVKIAQLIKVIEDKRELLFLLALYHYQCEKIGITRTNADNRQTHKLKFAAVVWFKLSGINESFWELMYSADLAHHVHNVKYNQQDLGLLDPKNFPEDFYNELKTGIYKGLDFRDVFIISRDRPKWIEKKETVDNESNL
ncbi:uncharacterized protein J8A68_004148 [[Candida] subhashii]|uniref:Uncharacterized protein n=1 Tax=[Candida] subhashii TaxID=561895 RepID=A0A8J5QKR4_9ASCO|nr:uncharacterized protein J8A68_004148 [[Candida] subhashii]KAG7662377.1 hypothetical protein J8A68_004148 [[Candida] subhashii]